MYTLASRIEGNQLQFRHFSFYGIYTSLAHQTRQQKINAMPDRQFGVGWITFSSATTSNVTPHSFAFFSMCYIYIVNA